MNTNHRNTATQHDAGQQGYARRAAAAPAGYTTYEGGDFRSAHSAYEPRPAAPSAPTSPTTPAATPRQQAVEKR